MSNNEIAEKAKMLFFLAAQFLENKLNPIEALYHEAKDLGFTGKSFKTRNQG